VIQDRDRKGLTVRRQNECVRGPQRSPFQLSIKWANPEDTAIDSASLRELSNATLVTALSGPRLRGEHLDRSNGTGQRLDQKVAAFHLTNPTEEKKDSFPRNSGIAKERFIWEVRFYVGLLDAERNDFLTEPFKVKVAFARSLPLRR